VQNPEIEALRKIDALDTKAWSLRREIGDLPEDLAKWKRGLQEAKDKLQLCQDEQKRSQQEIHKLTLETKSNQDTIAKYQVQQNTAKTNEEYGQLKKQMEALKKANGDLDDKQLALYEKIDQLKEMEKGLKLGVKLAEEKLGLEAAETKQDEARLQKELEDLLAEKKRVEGGVSPGTLSLYRRVIEKLQRKALAQVTGRTCQGCFIEIPPNTLSMILSGKEVVQCPQCARILFLERDYRAVTSISYTVGEKDRDSTSKDGNW